MKKILTICASLFALPGLAHANSGLQGLETLYYMAIGYAIINVFLLIVGFLGFLKGNNFWIVFLAIVQMLFFTINVILFLMAVSFMEVALAALLLALLQGVLIFFMLYRRFNR